MNAHPIPLALCALALAAPAAGLAQALPPPGGLTDLVGPRPLALGGGTGLLSGNDGIFVNPAATGARKRYSVDTLYAQERRGSATTGAWLGASVVDALSAPVAVSASYVHPLQGAEAGNQFTLGLAGAIAEKLYLGVQGRYQKMDVSPDGAHGQASIDAATADAGLLWEVSDYVTVGAAGFNLVPTSHEGYLPRTLGAGLTIGTDTSYKLVADWRADFDRIKDAAGKARTTNRFGVGLEAFLGNMVPVRAGFLRDETLDTTWWSAGAGLVTQGGVALDLGYRQSTKDPDARVLAVSFKMQFLNL